MPTITVRAENDAGDTLESVPGRSVEKNEELAGEMDHAEVVLSRPNWETLDASLDRVSDHLVIETDHPDLANPFFAGRFDDDERGDGSVTLHVVGYERDANDGEPTSDNLVYQNTPDSEIVADLLAGVETLSPGTVETIDATLSMSFSYANPSKALRDVEEATGGELRYNYDRTVDYVERRGADKSDIVLSPGEQTVIDDLEVSEDAREMVTHVRGFGAQSGPDQVTATGVIDSYESGDRQIWREYENKDIVDESRLQGIVDRLVEEYDGEPRQIEVETSTPAELDIDVGDNLTVSIPEENINRMLRVLRRRTILGSAGAILGVVLGNRDVTRDSGAGQEQRKKLNTFSRGYEGFVSRDTAPYGPEVAGDGNPREIIVPNWPDDIVEEITVDLVVQGFAWRSPVTALSHDHEVSIGSHVHEVSIGDHQHDLGLDLPYHTHNVISYDQINTSTVDGHSHEYSESVSTGGPTQDPTLSTTTEDGGATTTTSESGGGTTTTTDTATPLSPEVTTEFGGNEFYPSEVSIEVNGTEVATIAGDDTGQWTETIDLRGELTAGNNTITATPSTRGEINLIVSSELFRRGRSEN